MITMTPNRRKIARKAAITVSIWLVVVATITVASSPVPANVCVVTRARYDVLPSLLDSE